MIIFHQGLPGSGKSYEALVNHIVLRLRDGRHVWAYIEGLNHEKIAEATEIPVERVQELLHAVTREDAARPWVWVVKDTLIVIDEAQNFWPASRQPLGPEITKFVAEHRHLGVDILLMGQVLADVHALWRGRVDRRVDFHKMDALGLESRYEWSMHKQFPGVGGRTTWKKISNGVGKYDKRYFGSYASHEAGVEEVGVYKDKRAVIWRQPWVIYGMPALFVLVLVAVFMVRKEYKTTLGMKNEDGTSKRIVQVGSSPVFASSVVSSAAPLDRALPRDHVGGQKDEPDDLISQYAGKYRFRLVGLFRVGNDAQNGLIEVRAESGAGSPVDVLKFRQVEALGYTVMVATEGDLCYLIKGDRKITVTSWPVDRGAGIQADQGEGSYVRVPVAGGVVGSAGGVSDRPGGGSYADRPVRVPLGYSDSAGRSS